MGGTARFCYANRVNSNANNAYTQVPIGASLVYCERNDDTGETLTYPRCARSCTTAHLQDICLGMCDGDVNAQCCPTLGNTCIRLGSTCPVCPGCVTSIESYGATCPAGSTGSFNTPPAEEWWPGHPAGGWARTCCTG